MKVLQFGKYYPPYRGGIETVTFNIAEGLNEAGVQCDVLCFNEEHRYREDSYSGYRVYRVKSYGKRASIEIAPGLFNKFGDLKDRYDLIHIHMPNPMANLAVLISRPTAKIALYWHSDIVRQKYLLKIYEPLLRWLINRADVVIGATESHLRDSDYADMFRSKGVVIPYCFNADDFCERVDTGLLKNLSDRYGSKRIVFSVGRLIYYKGFDYLIRSARHLSDEYVILIGGEGEQKAYLEAIIEKEGLQGKVILLGKIRDNELPTYYKLCDIFCLPSIYRAEMFGMVQLEAMAFGKPVVSTRIERSGVSLVNRDGVTGIVVDPRNEKMLADAFVKLMSNADLYQAMSEKARTVVREDYAKGKLMSRLIETYTNIVRG